MYSNNVENWKYIGGSVKWEGCASGIFLIMTFILIETATVNFNIDETEKFDLFVRCWEFQNHLQDGVCKCLIIHKPLNPQLSFWAGRKV
jgi:hypothetical protein